LAQRSRKRGRHARPSPAKKTAAPGSGKDTAGPTSAKPPAQRAQPRQGQWFVPSEEEMSRSQRRDAEARAKLKPLSPGERPPVIVASALIAGLIGGGQLIAFFAGLKIHGKTPAAGGTIAFCLLMIACAVGMWRLWYGAVLGFMALLAIVVTLFSLFLIEASNVLGLVVALVIIVGGGYLFFKLVRVLSRIQMPRPPGPGAAR
jgi:hypothetical protein